MRSDTFAPETPHQAARSEPRLCGARDQEDVDPWTLSRTWPVKRGGMKCCGRENCRVVPSYDDLRARFSGNGVTARGRDGICPIDEAQVNRSALAFREHRARLNADFDGQDADFPARHSRASRTAVAGCQREHSRSEWPEACRRSGVYSILILIRCGKSKMDSGFRRNDGQKNQPAASTKRSGLETTTAVARSPVTFSAVRHMSRKRSTPRMMPMPSGGRCR